MKNRLLPFLAVLFGSISFGLLFMAIFGNATEVGCVRQPDGSYTCQLRTLLLGRVPISDREVEQIQNIVIAKDYSSDGSTYRAEFVRSNGEQVPLSVVWTDYDPVSKQVNAINSQMESREGHFTYRSDPPGWLLYLIGGLTLMSVLLSPLMLRK